MAQIDMLLARLGQSKASAALLRADAPMEITVEGRPVQGSLVSEAQLQALVGEIVPEAQRAELNRRGRFQFVYGSFDIDVDATGAKLQVTLRPASTSVATPSAVSTAATVRPTPAPAPSSPKSTTTPGTPKPAPTAGLSALITPPALWFTLLWGIITVSAIINDGIAAVPTCLAFGAALYVWKVAALETKIRRLSIGGLLLVAVMAVGLTDKEKPKPTTTAEDALTEKYGKPSVLPTRDRSSSQADSSVTTEQDATVDEVAYMIGSVKRAKTLGNQFSNTEADGEFIVVALGAQNGGKETHTLNTTLFRLLDSQGREFSPSSKGQTALALSMPKYADLGLTEVQPGISKVIAVVFDVPPGIGGLKLKIPAGTFSGGKDAVLNVP